ncbi:hypothetical protein ACIBL3_06285 [Kribbella sp. NPDC050124]|uniref:hypothetical protein n=1 Tax=Kribbella sp. NPDC050124 TaxID=3364114 RepID=UPI00379AB996
MRRTELARVRAAATQWRNGLAGLLIALVGFSLIKGRSDITELTPAAAAIVGVLLLLALLAGAAAALYLLRASNGRPAVVPVAALAPLPIAEHREAQAAARALRRGIGLSLACAALLVAAVASTWYGPARNRPKVEITTDSRTVCGSVLRIESGRMTLQTQAGEISVELNKLTSVEAVDSCPAN